MSSIFDKLTKILGFKITIYNYRERYNDEPEDGLVYYFGQNYYFQFSHEFDCGNTYIVYDCAKPIYYFMLYEDIDGEVGCPMLFEEK